MKIRDSNDADLPAIRRLYPDAFPDEDLLPLIGALLGERQGVLSLVAVRGPQLMGHAVFTLCEVQGHGSDVALLGPLAVAPASQRHGLGTALVEAGFRRLEDAGVRIVLVLGDPMYYSRFGFRSESRIEPPYPLPAEWAGAWQSKSLCEAKDRPRGRLSVPRPWCNPALWAP
jgi:putative acetyltransferase